MSLKKVGEVKTEKGFRIWDLIIYATVLMVAIALFVSFLITRDTRELKGVRIYYLNDVVFDYSFEDGEYRLGSRTEIISETDDALTVKVTAGNGYNLVLIDKGGSVKITEADCRTKDCVYTPEIVNNGGAIYCRTHSVKVVPYGYDIDDGNLIQ